MFYVVAVLAAYGLANILTEEEVFKWPRENILLKIPIIRDIFACRRCMSVWAGAAIAVGYFWINNVPFTPHTICQCVFVALCTHTIAVLSDDHAPKY